MFKHIAVLKRRPDMTMDEFRDYYENYHAVLGVKALTNVRRYVRRYVVVEPNPVTGQTLEPPFDVITEMWYDSREDFEIAVKSISGEYSALLIEDEKKLFASNSNPTFTVIEYESEIVR